MYKVFISVCHEPLDRFASYLDNCELGRTTGMFLAWFSKIVIYDQARVNGGSHYEYPGKRWVLQLVYNEIALILLQNYSQKHQHFEN